MTTDELIVMRLQDIRICDIGLRRVAAKRIKALTAERDAAYAQGYADAETEISKSALGQKNAFLLSQYVNAATSIKDLTAERERLALAICGGEDAPGYANAQTVETLEHVAKQNRQSYGATINSLLAAEAERDRLRAALAVDPWFLGRREWAMHIRFALKGETP